jgi:hypothetical protein
MKARVLRFPPRAISRTGVYCRPLNIYFPPLLRITTSRAAAEKEWGALDDDDWPGPDLNVQYALPSAMVHYVGLIETRAIMGMPDPDGPSLVIRHHRTKETVSGYINAHIDRELEHDEREWSIGDTAYTEHGIFTLAERPTNPAWPGPLVIYLAEIPARPNPLTAWEDWYVALLPDGRRFRLPTLEVPGNDDEPPGKAS